MNFNNNFQDIGRATGNFDALSLDCKVSTTGFLDAAAAEATYDDYMYDAEIEVTDVLCGRGKMSFNHGTFAEILALISLCLNLFNHVLTHFAILS